MRARVRSALLWGAIGGLVFLVAVQGYALVASLPIGLPLRMVVAVVVGGVTATFAYATEYRLMRKGST